MCCPRGTMWNDGSVWDCASFHDLVSSNRSEIIQAIQWRWIEKLPCNIEPFASIRAGSGLPDKKVEG